MTDELRFARKHLKHQQRELALIRENADLDRAQWRELVFMAECNVKAALSWVWDAQERALFGPDSVRAGLINSTDWAASEALDARIGARRFG